MEYRRDIDGLRSLAVLIVVFFHLKITLFSGGFIGVDIFFVISGYLVTQMIFQSVKDGTFSYLKFYTRRIRRLFPALLVVVISTIFLAYFIVPPSSLSSLAQSSIASLLSVSNFYFLFTADYFDNTAHLTPLLHTWSLSVEEQFYLIWPALIVFLAGVKARRNWVPIGLLIAGLASLILAEAFMGSNPSSAFFLFPFRVSEFAVGGIIGFLPALKHQGLKHLLALVGVITIIIASLMFTQITRFPGVMALIPVLGAAAIIYAGKDTWIAKCLSITPLVYIGKISYSLYLVHWPIIVLYSVEAWQFDGFTTLEQLGLFAATFALSVLLYHFVEEPFRIRKGRAKIAPNLSPPAIGFNYVSAILGVTLICAFIWGSDGLQSRYDNRNEINKLLLSMKKEINFNRLYYDALPETTPSILVIGDSHAGTGVRVFPKWGIENNIKVHMEFNGGCIPLLGVYAVPRHKKRLCEATDQKLKDYAERVDLVVLMARWGVYTNEVKNAPDGERRLMRSLHEAPGGKRYKDVERGRDVFLRGLVRTVDYFNAHNIPVVLITQVPPIGHNPENCIIQKTTAFEVERDCNLADLDYVNAEIKWSRDAVKTIPGLIVYDTFDLFCANTKNDRCKITHKGNMLYRDDDHLSDDGAQYVINAMAPVLKDVLAKE